jgi:hypothetical protein
MCPRAAALDRERLRALAERLGESPGSVARTLHDELLAARARIEAGLAAGDLPAVGEGAHAARNSTLMLDARPVTLGLRALQRAADDDDPPAARAAWARITGELTRLIEALDEIV